MSSVHVDQVLVILRNIEEAGLGNDDLVLQGFALTIDSLLSQESLSSTQKIECLRLVQFLADTMCDQDSLQNHQRVLAA
jgi:hypothetical protein